MTSDSTNINVRIFFFAKTRELSGLNESSYQLKSGNIVAADLLQQICSTFNLEVIRGSVILAINESYCDNWLEELQLQEGDEIAIIPPLSGG